MEDLRKADSAIKQLTAPPGRKAEPGGCKQWRESEAQNITHLNEVTFSGLFCLWTAQRTQTTMPVKKMGDETY